MVSNQARATRANHIHRTTTQPSEARSMRKLALSRNECLAAEACDSIRREKVNEVVALLFERCPHEPHKNAHVVGRAMLRILLAELCAQSNVSGFGHGAVLDAWLRHSLLDAHENVHEVDQPRGCQQSAMVDADVPGDLASHV